MMGGANGNYEECRSLKEKEGRHVQWVLMDQGTADIHDDVCDSKDSSIDSIASSSSSLDMIEDASSPSSSSSSSSSSLSSYSPLYELTDLMAQLPIKRGLSKYYQGKSQSFGCLASVKSLEDLAKKGYSSNFHQKRRLLKPCKSFGGGLMDAHKFYTTSPKPTITKNKKPSSTSSRVPPSFLFS